MNFFGAIYNATMDQKLFLEKLSEVAEWHWEKHQGQSGSDGRSGPADEVPTYAKLDKIKTKNCPYQEDKKDCYWKIYSKGYTNYPKVLIQKCETCGALMTPKGRYVANPDGYNYPKIIYETDRDE